LAPASDALSRVFQFFRFFDFVTCFRAKSGNKIHFFNNLERVPAEPA